jgi:hypothetical protein
MASPSDEFYQYLKKEKLSILLKFFQEFENEGILVLIV